MSWMSNEWAECTKIWRCQYLLDKLFTYYMITLHVFISPICSFLDTSDLLMPASSATMTSSNSSGSKRMRLCETAAGCKYKVTPPPSLSAPHLYIILPLLCWYAHVLSHDNIQSVMTVVIISTQIKPSSPNTRFMYCFVTKVIRLDIILNT